MKNQILTNNFVTPRLLKLTSTRCKQTVENIVHTCIFVVRGITGGWATWKVISDMFSTYRVGSRLSRYYLSCSKSARLISPQIHSISSSQENRKFSVVSRTGFSPVTNNSFITTCCKMSSSNQPQFSANFLFRQVKFELFFISMIDENKLILLRPDLKWCVWMCSFMHVYEYIRTYQLLGLAELAVPEEGLKIWWCTK